ncbi:Paxillin-like protein 1 [Nakaseomyces bracarensis]|uniref:Paxillin-like protein 1 n=1 Tax=Nakaseomyces bracarensis TaxID=273131 RepID=A0ABR4NRA4_9SACH
MYSSMYGSPFPKINPNVRYRTALERAGFDVNNNTSRRVVSGNSVNAPRAKSPPLHSITQNKPQNRGRVVSNTTTTPTKAPSIPKTNAQKSPVVDTNSSNHSREIEEEERTSIPSQNNPGPPVFEDDLPENPYAKSTRPPPQTATSNYPNNSKEMNTNQTTEDDLQTPLDINTSPHIDAVLANPIEKSFQMLTQNDTSMSLNSNTSEEIERKSNILDNNFGNSDYGEDRENSDFVPEIEPPRRSSLRGSNQSQSTSSKNIEDDIDADLNLEPQLSFGNNHQQDISDTESLEFNPNADLSANLEEEPIDYGRDINLNDPIDDDIDEDTRIKSLRLDNIDEKPLLLQDENPSQQFVELKSRTFQRVGEPGNNEEKDDIMEDDQPVTTTNLQVEKLIAQLDDVSLSRNMDINTGSDNSIIGTVENTNMDDIQRNSSKFKKSSAYLSGFPMDLNDINDKNIYDQDNIISNRSSKSSHNTDPRANSNIISPGNGTPVFYKFKQPSPGNFGSLDSLQPAQSDVLETPSKVSRQLEHNNVNIPEFNIEDTSNEEANTPELPTPEIKYPPGEGPCRRCKLDIDGKRIYSKKNNELSGQWHRQCFQCTKCSTTFSKSIPCYILNDQIYCQKHYHEVNNSICRVCQKFIEGECLENDKIERFHMHCLTCVLCKKIITNDYYIFNGEVPLCAEHDIDQLLNEGLMSDSYASNSDVDRKNTLSRRRTRLINFN